MKKTGFTLIEIMVSVSIFVIVALITVSVLLSMAAANRKAQEIRRLHDNLALILDSISLRIREKDKNTYIWCGNTIPNFTPLVKQNCPTGGRIIAFRHTDPVTANASAYVYEKPLSDEKIIFLRHIYLLPTPEEYYSDINYPSEIEIVYAKFYVDESAGGIQRVRAVIRARAKNNASSVISVQASISSRSI